VEKIVIISDRQEVNRMNPKYFPIIDQRIHKTKECDETGASSCTNGHSRRIMVVDDDEGIRHILSMALFGMGYEAVDASSGTEALNLLLKSSFALVLTDLEMPGMDGWNLASRIKNRFPNIPVILMTGHAREDVMERMKGSSVDYVIFKPFRLEDILKTAEKLLGAESSEKTYQVH
jgi:two-component system response regulator FlrC